MAEVHTTHTSIVHENADADGGWRMLGIMWVFGSNGSCVEGEDGKA